MTPNVGSTAGRGPFIGPQGHTAPQRHAATETRCPVQAAALGVLGTHGWLGGGRGVSCWRKESLLVWRVDRVLVRAVLFYTHNAGCGMMLKLCDPPMWRNQSVCHIPDSLGPCLAPSYSSLYKQV